ncbi:DUF1109 domain-containing protein [Pacificimonas flava]|uniref:Extracytoplasmic function alternative sigma factor n=1 Tax=Pacificimonas flava TaxID=1234595 RepID=M2U9G9_9SPHN|nr:DUF1109 domain-containing protein [Pacificimonas flava]EMD84607.1 extracytoplasmic function alternative sigma factor [Pacificimonas flava]MBB5279524.1 hypothetical protein [Pacificimonas flava]
MKREANSLIDDLAENLVPVRPVQPARGMAIVASAAAATMVLVAMFMGFRSDLFAGSMSAFFFITNGMIGLFGIAATLTVVRMANPRVGGGNIGVAWAAGMLFVLPASLLAVYGPTAMLGRVGSDPHGIDCFLVSACAGSLTFAALVFWLRRGAPVSLRSAGQWTGAAAGAVGSFAYGLACPFDSIAHLGVWHLAPLLLLAVIGRFAVPPLIRW